MVTYTYLGWFPFVLIGYVLRQRNTVSQVLSKLQSQNTRSRWNFHKQRYFWFLLGGVLVLLFISSSYFSGMDISRDDWPYVWAAASAVYVLIILAMALFILVQGNAIAFVCFIVSTVAWVPCSISALVYWLYIFKNGNTDSRFEF
jgi:hypothetical protein